MNSRGFTLVEMSVVLVIAGLILAAVMTTGAAQIAQSRALSSKAKEEAVRTALITFIARNNRLPCPAVPNRAPGVAGYGTEATDPGTCTDVPSTGAGVGLVFTGILPWSSLGLSDEGASDGYYNRLTYVVSGPATNLTSATVSGMSGNITVHSDTPIVLGSPGAGNQTNDCASGLPTNPCAAVAAIISHGANGAGAYTTNGERLTLPSGQDEVENTDGDLNLVIKEYTNDTADPYDDIVLAMPAYELLAPLTMNGSLKDYSSHINEDVEAIYGAVVSQALNNRTGLFPGTRSYPLPANLLSLLLPSKSTTDPWGNPYSYAVSTTPITASTTATNPAYTITSGGPDGVSGNSDDISQVVNVSDLKSQFINYGW